MKTISAVIITLNEERNIGRCLASVKDLVDEMIVVDARSKDRTVAICESFGARVIQRPWEGYSKSKNWANQQASSDYVLSVDADEALSPELHRSLLNAKRAGLDGVYKFNRLTNYCGAWIRHCGWYPDCKPRLFPKNAAEWRGDFVHESLHFSSDPKITWLPGDLLHYSYYSMDDHLKRIARYATLQAQKLKAQGKRANSLRTLLAPGWKFFYTYIVKRGFLDGRSGFVISKLSALSVREKYRLLRQLQGERGT